MLPARIPITSRSLAVAYYVGDMTENAGIAALRATKLKAENLDWAGVLEATSDLDLVQAEPRLLRFRVTAAAAHGQQEIVREASRLSVTANLGPMESFAIVRELVQAGYSGEAMKLLLNKDGLPDNPHFQRSAERLLKVTKGAAERKTLRAAIDAASKNGSKIKPVTSSFMFRIPAGKVEQRLGTVSLSKSSRTDEIHVDRLTADRDRFISMVERRKAPRVAEYSNVFVNRLGQIWDQDGAIIVQRGVALPTTDPSAVPQIDVAFNALAGTKGIYHWLVDRLPLFAGLPSTKTESADVPILLADNAPAFEADTLALAGIAYDRIARVGDAVFVKRLVVGLGGMSTLTDWGTYEPIIGPVVASSCEAARGAGVDLPDRVYISRSFAKRRPMSNEAEVEEAARARGFVVLQFETLPLWHQIAVVNNARTIMAPHGAGLAHLLFAEPGARVIEILPIKRGDGTYFLRWNYARISIVRGHSYSAWLEEQEIGREQWETQMNEFLPFLDQQLGYSAQ